MFHYDEIFSLKGVGAKSDVFQMLSGMWKTPVERCFLWLGGFHSSELLKILGNHLEPLMDQLMGVCNLQQSSQQAEDAVVPCFPLINIVVICAKLMLIKSKQWLPL